MIQYNKFQANLIYSNQHVNKNCFFFFFSMNIDLENNPKRVYNHQWAMNEGFLFTS